MQKKNTIRKNALAPTILIAGGAGFVGSHLAEVLLAKQARVVVFDNFSTGKEIYINHLLKNPKFALYDVDINQGLPSEVESVDYIFHLAGLEEYLFSRDQVDLNSLLTNAVGTKNLLDLARKSNAKFLLSSTIDVYKGMMSQINLTDYFGKSQQEERYYSLTEAKRYAEALVWEYHKRNSTDVRVVRFPEIFGPRMNLQASGSLGNLLQELIDRKDLTLKGDGSQKEYYIYINDAVSGMIKALLNENTAGKIFALIPKIPITGLELAYLVKSLADGQIAVNFEPDDKMIGEEKTFVPDTFNLSAIDWEPKVSVKDGIINTLQFFGYKINENSFKNAKFIEEKKFNDLLPDFNVSSTSEDNGQVSSLMDVKDQSPPENIFVAQNENSTLIKKQNQIPEGPEKKKFKFSLPRPHIGSIFAILEMSVVSKVLLFLVVLFSFLAVFVFYPTINVYKSAKKGMIELEKVPSYVSQFDSQNASNSSDLAYAQFTTAKKNLASLSWIYKITGATEEYNSISKFLSSVTYFSKVSSDLSKSVEPLKKVWEAIKPANEANFDQGALDSSKLHMSDAKNNLQLAKADFDQVDIEKLPVFTKEGAYIYKSILEKTEYSMDAASKITANLGDLLGSESPRQYLILFQNNNEIRPTGGFIGSYARIYLNKGKIEQLLIDDIYNPDGQLDVRNIKVSPPKPIGDLLAEDRLYIRNANWDPDFPRSAETIQDLFFKLDGERIDGVIAVDLNLVKNFLQVTGPIFLTAYNEEISEENLYERTQFYTSYDYTEGSTQKREFLTVLGSKLMESLFGLPKEKTPKFLEAVEKSLYERHMLVYLFSNQLNAFFQDKNWGGSLIRTDKDYLQVVNSNLGGTKANYYVDNAMDYKITSKTRDGLLRAELTLDYKHNGVDESWPGGPYTNYVRVLTQKGAKLTGAKITYDNTIEEDIFEKIVISSVDPYVSFETSFVVKPTSSAKLNLYYDLAENLSLTKDSKNYQLVWQKQAGTDGDKFNFSLSAPFGMQYDVIPSDMTVNGEQIISSGDLNEDFRVSLELK